MWSMANRPKLSFFDISSYIYIIFKYVNFILFRMQAAQQLFTTLAVTKIKMSHVLVSGSKKFIQLL